MESLALSLLVFGSSTAINCTQLEAQFIGKVILYSEKTCTYKIDYSYYREHQLCPLLITDGQRALLKDELCTLKNGDDVSGVLIDQQGTYSIEQ